MVSVVKAHSYETKNASGCGRLLWCKKLELFSIFCGAAPVCCKPHADLQQILWPSEWAFMPHCFKSYLCAPKISGSAYRQISCPQELSCWQNLGCNWNKLNLNLPIKSLLARKFRLQHKIILHIWHFKIIDSFLPDLKHNFDTLLRIHVTSFNPSQCFMSAQYTYVSLKFI